MSITITAIPAFKDNYIWAIINSQSNKIAIVDPGDAKPVFQFLTNSHFQPAAILITHKHNDHSGGINDLLEKFAIPIYGPKSDALSNVSHVVSKDDFVNLDFFPFQFKVFSIPGHTLEHIAYYAEHILFSGDTLFTGGCGRVFEGTYDQMYQSLMQLADLPNDTFIYCGHEYTLANLEFAKLVEPQNSYLLERIDRVSELRAKNAPTVPALLSIEKLTNPFLRCHENQVKNSVEEYANKKLNTDIEVFEALRRWKSERIA